MVYCFFIYSFRPQCGPGVDSASNRGLEIWKSQSLETSQGLPRSVEELQSFQILFSCQRTNSLGSVSVIGQEMVVFYFSILVVNLPRFVGILSLMVQNMPTFLCNLLSYENNYLKSGFYHAVCCAVTYI